MKRRMLMAEEKVKKILKIAVPILIAVFSFFIAFQWISSSGYVSRCAEAINRSRNTVLKLSASSAAASSAITALPGDLATPIAEELAQMSEGFLIVLCALYLEKFIAAVSGAVAFKWLIPIACGLWILGVLSKKDFFHVLAIKLSVLAAALLLVIPASLKLSAMVEDSYHESITQVIESAENSSKQIQEEVGENQTPEEVEGGLGKIIQSIKNSGDKIANGTSRMVDYFEKLLSRFVESLAIMLVISCGIPLLVVVAFAWMLKALFRFDGDFTHRHSEKRIEE